MEKEKNFHPFSSSDYNFSFEQVRGKKIFFSSHFSRQNLN
jgi:hypothetical protein